MYNYSNNQSFGQVILGAPSTVLATVGDGFRCLWLVALCLLVLVPATATAQTTCENALFVYVDISGSMYDLDLNPKVFYEGTEMFLFDAMLKFAGATFSRPGLLRDGDRFEIYGFAASVRPLAPPIRNYTVDSNYVDIRNLHDKLDENDDGHVAYRGELGISQQDIQKTNYPALLDDVQRKLRRYLGGQGGISKHLATVVIFTDGVDEAEIGELENSVDNLVRDFEVFFSNGQFNFIFLPLQDAPSTALFRRHPEIIVEEFYLRQNARENEGLIEDVQTRIQQTLRGTVQFGNEDVEVTIDEEEATFVLPLRNRSCSAERIDYVTYRIRPEAGNGDLITRTVSVEKQLEALGRDEAPVAVNLAGLPEGAYTIEFEMDGGGGSAARKQASFEIETSLPGPLIFFIFLVIVGLVFGGVMFYLRSNSQ